MRGIILRLVFMGAALAIGAFGENPVPNQVVVLNQQGLRPEAITRPQGGFVLLLLNRLGDRRETFTLVSADGTNTAPPAVAPLSTDEQHDYAYGYLELPPGSYQLNLKNHPRLSVKITITQ